MLTIHYIRVKCKQLRYESYNKKVVRQIKISILKREHDTGPEKAQIKDIFSFNWRLSTFS